MTRDVCSTMAYRQIGLGLAMTCLTACPEDPEPAASPTASATPTHEVATPPVVAPEPQRAVAHASQAEQARAILEQACGHCHIGPDSEAPAALAIFDLTEPDWTARITDEALEGFVARLEDMGLPKDQADIVIGHVSATLANRRAAQLAPPDC